MFRGGKARTFYVFLLNEALVLANQLQDLRFVFQDMVAFAGDNATGGGPVCVERVKDDQGDFGFRILSVHAAAMSAVDQGEIRFYAADEAELSSWIEVFTRVVLTKKSPTMHARKKSSSNVLTFAMRGLEKLRTSSSSSNIQLTRSPKSPRAAAAGGSLRERGSAVATSPKESPNTSPRPANSGSPRPSVQRLFDLDEPKN